MYVMGLLHDIGHIYGREDHEVHGSRLLQHLGFKFASEVFWHGTEPYICMRLRDLSCLPNELL